MSDKHYIVPAYNPPRENLPYPPACAIDLSDPDTLAAMREVARVLDLLTRQYEKGTRPIVAQVPVDSVRYARLVVAQEIIESKLREE